MLSAVNNSPNFKAVYKADENFSKRQNILAGDITKRFRSLDVLRNNGRTYEDNYEKYGYDFVVSPIGQEDIVSITGYKNMKMQGNERSSFMIFHKNDNFHVGEYDWYHKFDINDVEKSIRDKEVRNGCTVYTLLAGIFAIGAVMLSNHFNKSNVIEPIRTQTTLVVDSFKNAADTIAKDTIKLVPKNIK